MGEKSKDNENTRPTEPSLILGDALNEVGLWAEYGIIIQTGTAELMVYPERKETVSNNWAEENGEEYDLDFVRFKDKEVTLNMLFIADNDTDYWQKYNAFFAEISQPGVQELYIDDHSKMYNVFYKSSNNFKKTLKRLKNVDKVVVKFSITLVVLHD